MGKTRTYKEIKSEKFDSKKAEECVHFVGEMIIYAKNFKVHVTEKRYFDKACTILERVYLPKAQEVEAKCKRYIPKADTEIRTVMAKTKENQVRSSPKLTKKLEPQSASKTVEVSPNAN